MSDWIHCNKCFQQPSPSCKNKFFLTNCGHVFCDNCLSTGKDIQCGSCKAPCTTVLLTANLAPNIAECFADPNELLKRYIQARDFQKHHRDRYFAHVVRELQIVQNKYAQAKECIRKHIRAQAALEKDNQRLRNILKGALSSPHPNASKSSYTNSSVTPGMQPPYYRSLPPSADSSIICGSTETTRKIANDTNWSQNNVHKSSIKKSDMSRTQITSSRLSLPKSNESRRYPCCAISGYHRN